MRGMTQMQHEKVVPAWTLGWRLKRALDEGRVSAGEMALYLGVNRATVSRWMNDVGAQPKRAYVTLWAERCGVDLEWLRGDNYGLDMSWCVVDVVAA